MTLVSVLPACASLDLLNLGMSIHGLGVKYGVVSYISLTNSLIALYGKCGKIELARSLFDHMDIRTLVSWNAMIASYEQYNAFENSLQLFGKMLEENIFFASITMVSVISACTGLGDLHVGKQVHDLAKSKGLESNVSVLNALIDMYSKCGSIGLAKNVFNSLDIEKV